MTTTTPNGNYTVTAVARDAAGNTTTSPGVTVTVNNGGTSDTTAPTVSISAPVNGATVTGASVQVSATASDNVAVAGVQFRLNGTDLGPEDTSSPYSIIWNSAAVANGSHTLTAIARDTSDNLTTSAGVTVTVNNTSDTTAPTIFLASPLNESTVSGESVAISATVSDNVGVAGVQFRVDEVNLGSEDTTSPYSINWNTTTTPNDTYTLTAIARDADGNLTTSVPVTVTVNNISPSLRYSIADTGGASWNLTEETSPLQVEYARVEPDPGTAPPFGVAIFGYRSRNTLVSETGVPASAPTTSGRIYVETNGPVKTGIALANPSDQDTVVSFYFTDAGGMNVRSGSFVLSGNQQISAFLDEQPFNGPASMLGTFTFATSPTPVSAIALRGFTNERDEFLMTTLPVSPLAQGFQGGVMMFPHFVEGGGWTTGVVLINPTDAPISGTVEFLGLGSGNTTAPVRVRINGDNSSNFSYLIPRRGVYRLITERGVDAMKTGSVRITPDANNPTPSGLALFSYKNNRGITVSEASVPASASGSAFRLYVESFGSDGQIGSIRTGIAVSNPGDSPVSVHFELRDLNGTPTGFATTVNLPARGQTAHFIDEFLQEMPNDFHGVLRLTSTGPLVAAGLRGRYNERGDFLMTTTPPWNETNPAVPETVFPHVVKGSGYATQLIIFASSPGSSGSGEILFLNPLGR
jgi:hypothetical protein